MKTTCKFTYYACQTCHDKSKCELCGARIEKSALRYEEMNGVEIFMTKREVLIDTNFDVSRVEDCLEDLGLFLD